MNLKTFNLIIAVAATLIVGRVSAQGAQVLNYGYDAAGNRISRTIILQAANKSKSANGIADTTSSTVFSEQLGKLQLKIYPNPTKGILAVELIGDYGKDNIGILLYNQQGVLLKQIENTRETIQLIDMSTYPPAPYILRIKKTNKTIDYKIIKQ